MSDRRGCTPKRSSLLAGYALRAQADVLLPTQHETEWRTDGREDERLGVGAAETENREVNSKPHSTQHHKQDHHQATRESNYSISLLRY